MTSTMGCLGLGADTSEDFELLLTRVLPVATPMGVGDGYEHLRWTDPSGARLTILVREGEVEYALPSYAGRPGARLGDLASVALEMATADVLDAQGETATRLACEVEQMHFLPDHPVSGPAALTAFGLDVGFYADEQEFAESDDSLLDPDKKDEPRPDHLPEGFAWPTRMAAESFVSYGLFGDPAESEPHALLCGTVLSTSTHTVDPTRQTFHVARVRSVEMEVDLCLSAVDHLDPPAVGNVVSGTVYLVASLDSLWPGAQVEEAPRRRWFGRRR